MVYNYIRIGKLRFYDTTNYDQIETGWRFPHQQTSAINYLTNFIIYPCYMRK